MGIIKEKIDDLRRSREDKKRFGTLALLALQHNPDLQPEEIEEICTEATELFDGLPVIIRDPISRGGRRVTWSTMPNAPTAHDLSLISKADRDSYLRISELGQRIGEKFNLPEILIYLEDSRLSKLGLRSEQLEM